MNDNEKLIEEAAATIAVAELVSTHRIWGDLIEPQKDEYRRVARAVLAVFEKAHTPTDDEPSVDDRLVRAINVLSWRPDHDGDDATRVQDDYMRRAQAADTALAILTENREGAF